MCLHFRRQQNAPARSLRAALAKFAELAPLTRPSKCRAFVTSIVPPLVVILQRTEDEALQVWPSLSRPDVHFLYSFWRRGVRIPLPPVYVC
jgi:huntingtin